MAWKLRESPQIGQLYIAPGNAGTVALGENLPLDPHDAAAVLEAVERHAVGLTVIGPEAPLVAGLADVLREHGHLVFGPSAAGAQIEGSKAWAKAIMEEWGVPTGRAEVCFDLDAALTAIERSAPPVVVKADGLAAGKGVLICETLAEARGAVQALMAGGALGSAGETVLIEEFLTGQEVSLLAVTDGVTTVPLLPACDYKRVFDGDLGPNTGGMGAYAPPGVVDGTWVDEVMRTVVLPTLEGMKPHGIDYRGVLYAGLILTADGVKVIEFNCRMGDPEAQVVLPLLASDFFEVCLAAATGTLSELPELRWHDGDCVGVVVASGGYPGAYRTGVLIGGLDRLPEDGLVFHAGTDMRDGKVVTAGGRVLTAVGRGADLASARELAYRTAAAVTFEGAFFRRDIAAREFATHLP
jgi:phosphoribosylamine--glycine ligase